MKIEDKGNGELVCFIPERLDVNSADATGEEIMSRLVAGISHLELDLRDTVYASSAGLRVFLTCYRKMTGLGGTITLTHVQPSIMMLLDMTGFTDFLTIQK
ncbi:MAG: STAS domain-containing protein [Verrucomicrobia bacterium]|nr:STAS domain-containing protein [Verrucomicrobiota bacterium]MBR5605005.1 STAS domain-containing protein [Verrucomicrobiota bacterium]MBR5737127.1 STAS domain-containing protein [Verrucomicrobiota bacterium]MBR5978676.1 STAS domain-containing protein [Verrucomicrobiota bacterium]